MEMNLKTQEPILDGEITLLYRAMEPRQQDVNKNFDKHKGFNNRPSNLLFYRVTKHGLGGGGGGGVIIEGVGFNGGKVCRQQGVD